MKKGALLLLCSFMFVYFAFAQKKQADGLVQLRNSIMDEGRKLYQLEMTSILGAGIFKKELPTLASGTAGYFSYIENSMNKCVFFNNMYDAQILATITFDSSFNTKRVIVNSTSRPMTRVEKDLYAIRQKAVDQLKHDTTYFKMYTNTTTSILPLIDNNTRKVFVMTRSLDSTAVIFGNDYEFNFDNANFINSRKALHSDLISIDCVSNDPNQEEDINKIKHVHNAESGEYITSTDICILLLNQKKANWMHHVVIGQNFVSLWYCDLSELDVVTAKKWNKYHKKDSNNAEEPVAVKDKQKIKH